MSAKSKAEKHADTLAGMIDGKDDDLAKTLEPIRKFLLSLDKAEKTKSASDSKLVAAAPELLDACRYLLANAKAEGWSEFMLGDARSAIAKATRKS
jgi:hypothetical protein